jgi:hypothetical protein
MSIQSSFPVIKPTLLLDFAKIKHLDPRITFTRASTGTFYNSAGVLSTAASGVARFDFNPITNDSLGLLIEEQRTNLFTYSEDFSNAAWTKANSSITANAATAPDGALTADKLVENTATADHAFRGDATISAGATISFSIYAKAGERSNIRLQFADTATTSQTLVFFNLSNGTLSGLQQTGSSTLGSASITALSNGWYRCVLIGRIDGSATTARCRVSLADTSNNISYTGDGTSGAFIWGAQLEAGAFPTSYIQTVASQVTRAADAASMTGTNFSSWYNQAEGTLYAEANHPVTTGTGKTHEYVSFTGAAGNGYDLWVFNGTARYAVQNTNTTLGNDTSGAFDKLVMGYSQQTTFAQSGSLNAAAAVSSTTSMTRALNSLAIGGGSGSNNLNGTIKKIAYYPIRCTNAQLVALTS